jgi:hypothetical protein
MEGRESSASPWRQTHQPGWQRMSTPRRRQRKASRRARPAALSSANSAAIPAMVRCRVRARRVFFGRGTVVQSRRGMNSPAHQLWLPPRCPTALRVVIRTGRNGIPGPQMNELKVHSLPCSRVSNRGRAPSIVDFGGNAGWNMVSSRRQNGSRWAHCSGRSRGGGFWNASCRC